MIRYPSKYYEWEEHGVNAQKEVLNFNWVNRASLFQEVRFVLRTEVWEATCHDNSGEIVFQLVEITCGKAQK